MDDNEKQNLEKDLPRQSITTIFNVGSILQSIRIRRNSIFFNIIDRKFMEIQLRVVLYCGILFWTLLLLSQIV
jgi:hypothetical protein